MRTRTREVRVTQFSDPIGDCFECGAVCDCNQPLCDCVECADTASSVCDDCNRPVCDSHYVNWHHCTLDPPRAPRSELPEVSAATSTGRRICGAVDPRGEVCTRPPAHSSGHVAAKFDDKDSTNLIYAKWPRGDARERPALRGRVVPAPPQAPAVDPHAMCGYYGTCVAHDLDSAIRSCY